MKSTLSTPRIQFSTGSTGGIGADGASFLSPASLLAFALSSLPAKARTARPATEATSAAIPECPECRGDGCKACMGTGLTAEDFHFPGFARNRSQIDARLEEA